MGEEFNDIVASTVRTQEQSKEVVEKAPFHLANWRASGVYQLQHLPHAQEGLVLIERWEGCPNQV